MDAAQRSRSPPRLIVCARSYGQNAFHIIANQKSSSAVRAASNTSAHAPNRR